jgi:hypothetical protein
LILDYEYESESESDSSDDDPHQMLAHHKGGLMSNAKKAKFNRAIKAFERKKERKSKQTRDADFLPIDTLFDP